MPYKRFRFGDGDGLQLSPATKTQPGYLRMDNARIDADGIVEKRTGALEVARTTTTTPIDEIPADLMTAVWHREEELVIETRNRIYSRRECSGSGAQVLGTATAPQISDALDTLTERRATVYDVTIPLAGSALTSDAFTRLDRADSFFAVDIILTNALAQDIDSRLAFVAGVLSLTWDGAGVTPGAFPFPPGAANPGYYKVDTDEALVWVAVPPSSGRTARCDVLVYDVRALSNPARLEVTLRAGIFRDILGAPASSCVSGNATTVVLINDPGAVDPRLVEQSTPRALGASVLAFLAAGTDFVFDGLRGAVPAVRASVTFQGADTTFYLRFPSGLGLPATTEEQYPLAIVAAGDRVGIAYDGGEDVVAHRLSNSRHTRRRDGGVYRFDDVDGGELVYRYALNATPSLALTRLVAGVAFVAQELAQAAPREDFEIAAESDGRHLGFALGFSEQVAHFVVYADPGLYAVTIDTRTARCGGVSSDGVVAAYAWADDTPEIAARWTNDHVSFSQTSVAMSAAPLTPSYLALSAIDDGPPDALLVVAVASDAPASALYRQVDVVSFPSAAPATATRHTEPLVTVDLAALSLYQVGVWPRVLLGVGGSTAEVYEVDTALYVRVSPPTVTLPGGNWLETGKWTRTRLRVVTSQDWGGQTVEQTSACAVRSPATGGVCIVQMVEVGPGGTNAGLQVIVYSTHAETGGIRSPLTLGDVADPHTVNCGDDRVALTYVDPADGQVYFLFWRPGDSFSFASAALTAGAPLAPVYDLAGGIDSTGREYYGLIVYDDSGDVTVQFRDASGPTVDTTVPLAVDTVLAVAIYAVPEPDLPTPHFLVAATGTSAGGYTTVVQMLSVDASPAFAVVWSFTFETGAAGDLVRQITVGADRPGATADTGLLSVEVSPAASSEWDVRTYEVTDVSATLTRQDLRATVFGAYAELPGPQLVHWQSSIEVGQAGNKGRRSGIFGISARTGEYVTRWGYGVAEDFVERAGRRQVSDANRFEDLVVMGYGTESASTGGNLSASKYATVDTSRRPHCPAQLQRVVVGAHGGFPRLYDSSTACEHDWHETLRVTADADVGGGVLAAGEYGYAGGWEWTDNRGNLYRCIPWFGQITLAGGSSSIELTVNSLTRTERRGPRAVLWRTLLNDAGGAYRRVTDVDALGAGASSFVVTLTATDDNISGNETLDQVGGYLPSLPAPVTNFVGEADGRFWAPDPERADAARYTTVASEGFAPHWPSLAVEGPGAITSVTDMLGRVVVWTNSSVAYTSGGPTNGGRGAYPYPSALSLSTGTTDHCAVTRAPFGFVYGTTRTPHLLNGGLTSQDLGKAITRVYEIDREVARTAVYRPRTNEVVIANGPAGRTFRYFIDGSKWAEDPPLPLRDQSESKEQEYAQLVADGRVLVRRNADALIYTDGAVKYPLVVSSPWMHSAELPVHGMFEVKEIFLFGEYLDAHDLVLSVYLNYQAQAAGTWRLSAAQLLANQLAGMPYLARKTSLTGPVYAARVEVSDDSEGNATLRLEGIDVFIEPRGTGNATLPEAFRFE